MKRLLLACSCLALGLSPSLVKGQAPDLLLSLDASNKFLLTGNNVLTPGLEIESAAGILTPASNGQPFGFLLSNTPHRITYGSLGAVRIDGTIQLDSGIQPVGGADVEYSYGTPEGAVAGPFPLGSTAFVSLEGSHLTVTGRELALSGLDLASPTGSLVPSPVAAPFSTLGQNTSQHVEYRGQVTLDGAIRLGTQWNRNRGARDVTYQLFENAEPLGPARPITGYPEKTPTRLAHVRINDQQQFTVTGQGQEIFQLEFASPSGSLVPATAAAPFVDLVENTNQHVVFHTPEFVSIDGTLTLPLNYNLAQSGRDIQVTQHFSDTSQQQGSVSRYPHPQAMMTVNGDKQLVLSGTNQQIHGLELNSRAGSLVPPPIPNPFSALGENDAHTVHYQGQLVVDGSLTLAAEWNPQRQGDITYAFDLPGGQSSPRSVSGFPGTTVANVTIDDDHHFVVHGNGQEFLSLRLQSRSGSLIPAETPAPFDSFDANDFTNVGLVASSVVKIDGSVKLSPRYNPNVGGADVTFSQRQAGSQFRTGRVTGYPEANRLQVSLNADSRFVLTGSNLSLLGFDISSASSSLLTGGTPEPFDLYLTNTAEQITYGVLGKENAVELDGSLTLGSGWNPLGQADVRYQYGLTGGQVVGPFPLFRAPPADLNVVRMKLTPDHHWVLEGDGQSLEQLDIVSADGGLVPAATPAPFQSLTENSPERIQFKTAGQVTVDGELTLPAAWNRDLGIRDVSYLYVEKDAETGTGPFVVTDNVYPPRPPATRVGVDIREGDFRFVLTGRGHELRALQFESPSGSLIPGVSPAPFTSFAENTTTSVRLATNSFVTLDGEVTLDTAYNRDVAGEDVSYRYDQVGFADPRGPHAVDRREYPPNPQQSPLRLQITNEGQFVAQGIGQRVVGLTIASAAGSLETQDDPAPFLSFLTDTPELVELAAGPDFRIEGTLVLPVSWNGESADVTFSYTLDEVEESFGPATLPGGAYPSDSVIHAIVNSSGDIILFGSGQLITSVEVFSPSGSLLGAENPAFPFSAVEIEGDQRVRYDTDAPLFAGAVRLPLLWNNRGAADLQVFVESTGLRPVVTQVSYGVPVPEPTGGCWLVLTLLGALRARKKNA